MSPKRARKLQVGDTAPDFSLPSHTGDIVTLRELLRKKAVVLYFYPRDNTPGCTAEACGFRDQYEKFVQAGAEVVGISADSVQSHQRFAGKHRLPFLLLSDPERKVHRLYGVPQRLGFWPGRVTFVIDRNGIIRKRFSSQFRIDEHIAQTLQLLQQ